MMEFLVAHKLIFASLAAAVAALIIFDFLYSLRKHGIRRGKELFKKSYGDGDFIYGAESGGLLSCHMGDSYLIGKPDIVLQDRRTKKAFVVDLKSGKAPEKMSSSHELQLAAYFVMVEENFPLQVEKGIIRYLDDGGKELSIANSPDLKMKLERRVADISAAKKLIEEGVEPELARNHCDPRRCRNCNFKKECPDSLGFNGQDSINGK